MRAKLLGLSLGVAAIGVGVGGAQAQQVVGNPTQSNAQSNNNSQVGVESGSCPAFICSSTKTQTNSVVDGSTSGQNIVPGNAAAGGVLVGNSGQANLQGDNTWQTLVGGKTETNSAAMAQGNAQNVAGGAAGNSLVVGAPTQSNGQGTITLQGAKESSGGPGSIIKGPTQTITNVSGAATVNCQSIATGAAICM